MTKRELRDNENQKNQKVALLVSYVGTSYLGWQTQKAPVGYVQANQTAQSSSLRGFVPEARTIQTTLESALAQILREKVRVVGSGRTDSGVHALGQVAHFWLPNSDKSWDEGILRKALNGVLPSSIRILQAKKVPGDFHAQRSAQKKQYSFYFQQGPSFLPQLRPYSWWIQRTLDLDAMNEALEAIRGEHDFKAFQASGSHPGTTVRRILEASVQPISLGFPDCSPFGFSSQSSESKLFSLVRFQVVGTGFLKQMVRGLAGTLAQIGEKKRPASDMKLVLEAKKRELVGPTAPARALWLERVWYPESFGLWEQTPPEESHGK